MSEQEITNLKISMEGLSKDISYIKEGLEKHISKEDENLQKFIDAIEKFTENAEKRFAGKWLETLVVRLGWIIITPMVGALLYFTWQLVILFIHHQ